MIDWQCNACGRVAVPATAAACPLGEWCELRIADRLRAAAAPPPREAVDTGLTPMTGDFE